MALTIEEESGLLLPPKVDPHAKRRGLASALLVAACFVVSAYAASATASPVPTALEASAACSRNCVFTSNTLKTAVNEWVANQQSAESKYGHIKDWDTSQVTSMAQLFDRKASFNEPLNNWNVANVKNMRMIFSGALAFNQP